MTGGEGFRFEDDIAARFLLDGILGVPPIEPDLGQLRTLHWQAREMGWLLDDLVLETGPEGDEERWAAVSIKLDRQVTQKGFPSDFVRNLWCHFLGVEGARKLRLGRDHLVLVVGRLAANVREAWERLLREASITTPGRLRARLRENGGQSSAIARALFKSLACPSEFGSVDDDDVVRLLCHLRLLAFDSTTEYTKRAELDARTALRTGDNETASELWGRLRAISSGRRSGGTLTVAALIQELKTKFALRDHPDYDADWRQLASWSEEGLAAVGTSLDDLASIPRTAEAARVIDKLSATGLAVVVGESGAGKSALLKAFVAPRYGRVVWLSCEDLEATNATALQIALGLKHSFVEIFGSAREPVLLVLDGGEGLSADTALFVGRMILGLLGAGTSLTHVAVTVQTERLPALTEAFTDARVLTQPVVIEAPSEAAIQDIARSVPALGWSALRPELKPALRNLKMLDWTLRAVRSGKVLDARAILNVSQLIGMLWRRLPGEDGDGLERSRVLMEIGRRDGDGLTGGVFRTPFDGRVLGELIARGLVRLRNERVSFGHDMLGDWARLHLLLGEGADAVAALRVRATRPRWHRAIRLYAQALLDLPDMGPQAWRTALTACDDGTEAGAVVRDLLLEAVVVASNAADRITALWPLLLEEEGRLLRALLERFLIVATLPDPQFAELFKGHDLRQLPLSCRIPFAPYWGGVLKALHLHRADAAKSAADLSATIASKWLSWTEPVRSRGVAWRREAAGLALALAREAHAQIEEGDTFRSSEEVFQALLHAAPEAPDDVATLALELAQRRELSADVATRRDQAVARREEKRRSAKLNGRARRIPEYLTRSIMGRGRMRPPWPLGPKSEVDEGFASACRLSQCIASLASVRPAVARELILAITIESPKEENPHNHRDDDVGLVSWMKGYPPLYMTGPWHRFLLDAPFEALSTILQLVNFATERWEAGFVAHYLRDAGEEARAPGFDLDLGNERVRVVGDTTVFQWHYRSSLGNGMLHGALIALEKYLYGLVDSGADVSPLLERILRESRSMAFVGLLLDIGKRHEQLLTGVLRPLLGIWEIYELDAMKTFERSVGTPWMMIPWGSEPAHMRKLASEWFGMPHRRVRLRDLIPQLLLSDSGVAKYFDAVRASWSALLRDGQPESLELLIARFDPANYPTGRPDGFEWPAPIARRLASEMREMYRSQVLMFLPMRAGKWLSGEEELGDAELETLWPFLQRVAASEGDYNEVDPREPRDAMFAALAAIVVKRFDWLAADSTREKWCRNELERSLSFAAPAALMNMPFDLDRGFDAFAAEAGLMRSSKKLPDAPGAAEVQQMLAARGWVGVAIALAVFAGMRSGEVRAIEVRDVDLAERRILIRRAFSENVSMTPKNSHERVVPLVPELEARLRDAMKNKLPKARIVIDENGNTPRRQQVLHRFQKFLKEAGIRRWSFHSLRHFFISELVRRGAGLEAVRLLAGHSKLEMTQRYAHATAADLRSAMDKLAK